MFDERCSVVSQIEVLLTMELDQMDAHAKEDNDTLGSLNK